MTRRKETELTRKVAIYKAADRASRMPRAEEAVSSETSHLYGGVSPHREIKRGEEPISTLAVGGDNPSRIIST